MVMALIFRPLLQRHPQVRVLVAAGAAYLAFDVAVAHRRLAFCTPVDLRAATSAGLRGAGATAKPAVIVRAGDELAVRSRAVGLLSVMVHFTAPRPPAKSIADAGQWA